MTTSIVPVILSGGSGTRLWPVSNAEHPKQLLALTAPQTMLQLTALRAVGTEFAAPIVVAGARHADVIEAQLDAIDVSPQLIILEPVARNTAPAIALAALSAAPGDALLVMPSDHIVRDVEAFRRAVDTALPLVEKGWLVTFGITPEAPETGYGWIQTGEAIADNVHTVRSFIEKPVRERAETMFASGGYFWNGGIFLFRADRYLEELGRFAPEIARLARLAVTQASRDGVRIHPDASIFAASPSDSIDYAVMEKADRVAVVPVSMGWSDVGNWDALYAVNERDTNGNAFIGNVVAHDARNCLVRSDGPRVALVGVDDLVVVVSGRDVLVMPRSRSQDVKTLVGKLGD